VGYVELRRGGGGKKKKVTEGRWAQLLSEGVLCQGNSVNRVVFRERTSMGDVLKKVGEGEGKEFPRIFC